MTEADRAATWRFGVGLVLLVFVLVLRLGWAADAAEPAGPVRLPVTLSDPADQPDDQQDQQDHDENPDQAGRAQLD